MAGDREPSSSFLGRVPQLRRRLTNSTETIAPCRCGRPRRRVLAWKRSSASPGGLAVGLAVLATGKWCHWGADAGPSLTDAGVVLEARSRSAYTFCFAGEVRVGAPPRPSLCRDYTRSGVQARTPWHQPFWPHCQALGRSAHPRPSAVSSPSNGLISNGHGKITSSLSVLHQAGRGRRRQRPDDDGAVADGSRGASETSITPPGRATESTSSSIFAANTASTPAATAPPPASRQPHHADARSTQPSCDHTQPSPPPHGTSPSSHTPPESPSRPPASSCARLPIASR
jgi:hypothetical protein